MTIDLLILSNGPGEITTWVRPAVKALRQQFGDDRTSVRISVILSPCPNGTGTEAKIVAAYPEVDRVQSAESFFSCLLWGKTAANWDWRAKGAVIFLGGDQLFTLVIAKRLGYASLIYAEWDARWYRYIDQFALRNDRILSKIPNRYHHKCTVVGDLMADIPPLIAPKSLNTLKTITIGFLPGSKPAKLSQGVPLCLAIAQHLDCLYPQLQFILPLAPTLSPDTLSRFANPQQNPISAKFDNASAVLICQDDSYFLQTPTGTKIQLITQFPAHDYLRHCQICITTVGANTAELAALGVPMLVLLPTQELDAMRAWDGVGGLLANLPLIGSGFAKAINWLILRQKRSYAWPNIWAGEQIVPELVGKLQAVDIAKIIVKYLDDRVALQEMSDRLRQINPYEETGRKIAKIAAGILK
jgi:lipid A disaccharide synthetase